MTQAPNDPSTATRRTGGSQPTLNGHGPGEQDLRDKQELVGDRDRDRGNGRDHRTDRNERDSRDEYSDQRWGTERGEQDLRRDQGGVRRAVEQVPDRSRAATSNPVDAFAVTPDMSKVFTAWFDMAADMMKLQQQFISTVLGAGNTNARTTTKV